ncbi:unnamed protein product [Rotaria sp. Silwood2]|nr:unnamed protein product [Rotaria sp. Silwood2]CAF3343819.1 unnamed protein product [Rotaria sp. Silwood2]
MESIITTNVKENMENQIQNLTPNIRSEDKVAYKTNTNGEKEELDKTLQIDKEQLLDLQSSDEINKTQMTSNSNIADKESIHENQNKSEIITKDNTSTTSTSVTSKSNIVQSTISSKEFHNVIKDQDTTKYTESKEKMNESKNNAEYSSFSSSENFTHNRKTIRSTECSNDSSKNGAANSLRDWQFQSRPDHRSVEIKTMFEFNHANPSSLGALKISSPFDVKEIISRASINAYFDMICRDGSTTAEIGKYLNLSKENIFGGTDYDSHNDNVTFVNVNLNQSTIDLADNRVDLITCFVVLHHVPQLDLILPEFVRILRPGGYLIMREHDCKKTYSLTAKYLNFIHAFMMIARVGEFAGVRGNHLNQSEIESDDNSVNDTTDWVQQKFKIIQYTKSIQYRTRAEWQHKLENAGFRLKATLEYDQSSSANPQKLYYAVFQLNAK